MPLNSDKNTIFLSVTLYNAIQTYTIVGGNVRKPFTVNSLPHSELEQSLQL